MTEGVASRALLRAMFDAAVNAAAPDRTVLQHLPHPPEGRTVVVGAGKAAAAMARAVDEHWDGPLDGLVVTRDGYGVPSGRIQVLEAGHPVPDQRGVAAAQAILDTVAGLTENDLVIALISGGGSALLALPAPGLSLNDKRIVTEQLLRSGANINDMNIVRKHLSAIKGGRLAAAAYPARVSALLISDVAGDDLGAIASGPTVGEDSSPQDALDIIADHGIHVTPQIRQHLQASTSCPRRDDIKMSRVTNTLVAAPQMSLEAAAAVARNAGVTPVILGDSIEGEAREVGTVMAGIANQLFRHSQPAPAPAVLISGGETTVTVRGSGMGGPNVEFLLSLATKLDPHANIHAVACDTDGVDGSLDVAGAFADTTTVVRARDRGMDPARFLRNNDAHTFFGALGDQIVTGPTLTNVNDFRAVLVL